MQAAPPGGAEVSLAGERTGLGPVFGAGSGDKANAVAEARRDALRLAGWPKGETARAAR